jgi:hypothetical protein
LTRSSDTISPNAPPAPGASSCSGSPTARTLHPATAGGLLDPLQIEGRDHGGLVDDDQGAGLQVGAPGCPLGRVGRIGAVGAAPAVRGANQRAVFSAFDPGRFGELIGRDLGRRQAQHPAAVVAPVVGERPHRGGLAGPGGPTSTSNCRVDVDTPSAAARWLTLS